MRRSVKSRSKRARWAACLAGVVAGAIVLPGLALGQPAPRKPRRLFDPAPLLAPEAPTAHQPVQTDPWLPTGAALATVVPRPAPGEPAACSFRHPVCVHRGAGVSPERAGRALAALERAYARAVHGLELPAPIGDAGRGGSDALDLYLVADGDPEVAVGHEAPDSTRFDRSAGYCVVGRAERTPLDRSAALCVGEAIALTLDPAETPHLRRAYATHLWWVIGHPTALDAEAVDDLQANPELPLATRERSRLSEGAALVFEHLDAVHGVAGPGALATGLLAASASKTDPAAARWDNTPDVFDVLRHTFGDKPREVATLLGDLAVARAFVGDRDDGSHLPALEWLGSAGRVRFDWIIPVSTLPRRVAAGRPIQPTGAIYVWVALDQVPTDWELGFQAEWEAPVSFQWTLVSVDAEGRELTRLRAPFVERGTKVEQTLVDLEGAVGVIVVGTNLGGVDLAHPFDPDHAPFEPHACTVYLAKL